MARTTGANAKTSPRDAEVEDEPIEVDASLAIAPEPEVNNKESGGETEEESGGVQSVDDILNSLKTLLSTVEKLQKIRQEVGDIKPLLVRMLDGELVAGDDLEQLKTGVSGLLRLVRAHSDHQAALAKAQTARTLLDEVLSVAPSHSA
jgi:hypothetical protein